MDERSRKVRELMEPSWDELRERRVLDGILERHRKTRRERNWRRRFVLLPLTAAAAAACVVLVWLLIASRTDVRPVTPPDDFSTLHLADGSEVMLPPGGRVEVEHQQQDEIRLAQHIGKVRYRVSKKKRRTFVVRTHGVSVRVVGTIFTIEIEPATAVKVSVERGVVEVDDGRRKVQLSAGEQLVVSLLEPSPPPPLEHVPDSSPVFRQPPRPRPQPTVEELLARVDESRKAGHLDQAVRLLNTILGSHPEDPGAVTARFVLGKVEKERGRHLKAAEAFHSCRAASPRGPLAEDALAEEANALSAAGHAERARDIARKYLQAYPRGTHTARMEILAR